MKKNVYMMIKQKLTNEEIKEKVRKFEKKYSMPVKEYYKKVVEGHEDELDEKGLLSEYDDWVYYDRMLRKIEKGETPIITKSIIKYIPEEKFDEIDDIFTVQRLKILKLLNKTTFGSISQLSRRMQRDRGSVAYDLNILKKNGLVKLEKADNVTRPLSTCKSISFLF